MTSTDQRQDDQPSKAEEPSNGLPLGRPFGVPVFLSYSWFIGAALITWLFYPMIERQLPDLADWALAIAFCFAVLLGLSVLIHELAHAVAALRFGQTVRRINLHLLGGVSEIVGPNRGPGTDFVIAVVGPLASLALSALGFGLVYLIPDETVLHLVAWQLAVANLIVGIFNLIPGLPLDGGRMLRDVVWAISGREHTGTVVAAWTGRALAVGLVVLALLPMLLGNNDIIWLVWGIILASFIWFEAGRALQGAKVRSVLPTLSARTLTRRAIPLPGDLPVNQGLQRLADAGAGAIVTLGANGEVLGIVNETAVAALPEHRRPWVNLAAVSRSVPEGYSIGADLMGEDLVNEIADRLMSEYLVVEADGRIYGVLAAADVEAALTSELSKR